MSFFTGTMGVQPACTSNIHRPLGGIEGYREVHDDVSRLSVCAFPFADVKDLTPARASVPACYILADHAQAYIGETGNLGRRLSDHAGDPAKAFAREVYAVSGYERAWFDKTAAIYLQDRLTGIAEKAGLVDVIKGVSPQVLDLPNHRRASLDRFVEHGERLLFDAGCRVFRSSFASQRKVVRFGDGLDDPAGEGDENGPMRIGVITAPPIGSERELDYVDLWARGYPANDGFVVMAGSEVRTLVNASVNPILHTRRAELNDAQALMRIPGVTDRQRLRVAVWFPSAAIAAKVVTGAHVAATRWIEPAFPRPIIIAA